MNSKVAAPTRQLQIEHEGDIPQSIASLFAPALRTAIDEGDASGVAKGNVFARVREIIKLPPPR